MRTLHPNRLNRTSQGFTLAEVLIAGSLGAILLTALMYATMEFSVGVTHLELESGVVSEDDAALRQITREIRESWHAEIVDAQHVTLFDEDDNATHYEYDQGELSVTRPNGDTGVLVDGLNNANFEGSYVVRHREGSPADLNAGWWASALSGSGMNFSYEVPGGSQVGIAFIVPVLASDLPSPGADGEQVLGASSDTFSMPLAFVPGTLPESMVATLYEARGPGAAIPYGSPVLTLSLPAASLPVAIADGSDWEVPSTVVSLSTAGLASDLVAGRGYVLVLEATGDAQLVLSAEIGSPGEEEIRLNPAGMGWVPMFPPVDLPLIVSGAFAVTSTTSTSQVNRISVTLYPDNRPDLTRSASILSQAYSDDPWHGVVPGQEAP
jgi:hypothetical protein